MQLQMIARCWKIEKIDGKIITITDHDQKLLIDGLEYVPDTGASVSAIENNMGMTFNNLEISGVFSHNAISKIEIENGSFFNAKIIGFEYDWNLQVKGQKLFEGEIFSLSNSNLMWNAELGSSFHKLNRCFSRSYSRLCGAELGDNQCGVDLNEKGYSSNFEVLEVHKNYFLVRNVDTFSPRCFELGVAIFEDINIKYRIVSDEILGSTRKLHVRENLLSQVLNPTNVHLIRGCNRTIKMCSDIFGNQLNFQGFPHIPVGQHLVLDDQ